MSRLARPGCLALIALGVFAILFPIFLANAFLLALEKLGLSPLTSLLAVAGIFLGSLVNLPVHRIPREVRVPVAPVGLFGLSWGVPRWAIRRTYTVIAVNLGGCVVPGLLALYELGRLAMAGLFALLAALVAIAAAAAVCYRFSRPVAQGIMLRPIWPALTAVAAALILSPLLPEGYRPAVAFAAGVLGPLIGADLLHLKDLEATPMASIGGAGTFDGIVLSGLVATLLA